MNWIAAFRSAHEAYVLTREQFAQGLKINTPDPLAGLLDSSHIGITICITILVTLAYLLVIFWSTNKLAQSLDKLIRKLQLIGPVLIRLAVSAAFIYGSFQGSFLGPELAVSLVPFGGAIKIIVLILGLMILFGLLTEIAALVSLAIFIYMARFFGPYMITYANYFGEFLVLFLFGSRFMSLDRIIFGKITLFKGFEKYRYLETPIVRVLYGLGLIYAGWNIKFAHQNLSILVYNQYHLQNFFHASASFIASGAGVSEILIGLFIMLGFASRFTILISLVFITLSLLYFRELVWPHFILFGISFSLIINSADQFTIDRYLIPWVRRHIRHLPT